MASIRRRSTETAPPIRRQSTGNQGGGRGRRGSGSLVDADIAGDDNGEVKERRHHCSLCTHSYFHKGDLNRHVRMVRVEAKARELDARVLVLSVSVGRVRDELTFSPASRRLYADFSRGTPRVEWFFVCVMTARLVHVVVMVASRLLLFCLYALLHLQVHDQYRPYGCTQCTNRLYVCTGLLVVCALLGFDVWCAVLFVSHFLGVSPVCVHVGEFYACAEKCF